MTRYGLLVPHLAGALPLIVAEFVTVREIRAVTVVPPGGTTSGGGLHGYASGVIGVAIVGMPYGPWCGRGAGRRRRWSSCRSRRGRSSCSSTCRCSTTPA